LIDSTKSAVDSDCPADELRRSAHDLKNLPTVAVVFNVVTLRSVSVLHCVSASKF